MGRLIEGGGERHQVQNIVQSTRKTFGVPSQVVLIESSDKIVRLSEACETRLWELEQQFEVKAAKVREEYLAAVLEIHASEANGNQHGACRAACEAGMSAAVASDLLGFHCGPICLRQGCQSGGKREVAPNFSR